MVSISQWMLVNTVIVLDCAMNTVAPEITNELSTTILVPSLRNFNRMLFHDEASFSALYVFLYAYCKITKFLEKGLIRQKKGLIISAPTFEVHASAHKTEETQLPQFVTTSADQR